MVPRSARVLAAALALTLMSSPMAATKKKKPAGPPPPPSACVDLYANANAGWLGTHPVPAGLAAYSRWDELKETASQQARALLRDPTPGAGGPAARLLADLIASSQDTAAIDAAGPRALQPLLAQVAGVRKGNDAAAAVAALHAQGVPVLFAFDVEREVETGQPRARFRPAGLGLEDPVFYTAGAVELQPIKGLYRSYLTGLLRSAGVAEAEAVAQADLAIAM
jgi:putative endopeptidase